MSQTDIVQSFLLLIIFLSIIENHINLRKVNKRCEKLIKTLKDNSVIFETSKNEIIDGTMFLAIRHHNKLFALLLKKLGLKYEETNQLIEFDYSKENKNENIYTCR